MRPEQGGAKQGKSAAAGGGVAPGAAGKAVRGRGSRPGRGDRSPGAQRSAAGGGRTRARGARHSLVGEIGAQPVGDWAGLRGPERGAAGAAGMSGPSGRSRPAAWPAARNGGGRRRGGSDPLARGPSAAGRERSLPTTLPGPRSHAVLASHPRRPHTRPERAEGRSASPSPTPPSAALSCPAAKPAPPAPLPGCPQVGSSPRLGTEGGQCTGTPGLCAFPPALAVKPSAFPWEVLWSHPEAGRRSGACPWQPAGQCWPLSASSFLP